ncbi:MAG: glycosyltransferase family 2 protein [candidate division Zixibacteria bacterium]|nr:glycosyltransferase family 2 protein [candidate division Zixibacteria bacterium]MDH3938247.1 glycosyltransferase family 2 protein [candidate division Zixibacteria bacterium]MDH4035525.1 glycosyltransferase family 2 protein [candidate division Zixibacteria bacterium]
MNDAADNTPDTAETISAVIITKNEEANIARCLKALSWVDEIVVVDSGSNDDTRQLATELGAAVFEADWNGFGPTKALGVDKATSQWIISVDADEVVSPQLASEIQKVLIDGTDHHGFDMPRKTNFLGRWIHHCGWYPDRVLRLFLKAHGNFNDAPVHERVVLKGDIGHLKEYLLHYSYPSLEHYLVKSNRYTTLGAQKALTDGRRANWFDIVIRPTVSFLSHYISRQGFRDGLEGLLISVLSAVAVMMKYSKLRVLQNEQRRRET